MTMLVTCPMCKGCKTDNNEPCLLCGGEGEVRGWWAEAYQRGSLVDGRCPGCHNHRWLAGSRARCYLCCTHLPKGEQKSVAAAPF